MIGVGIVTADDWFIRYFAAADPGRHQLPQLRAQAVQVPIAVAGQAVGQASMPFFALPAGPRAKRVELGDLVTRAARTVAASRWPRGGAGSRLPRRRSSSCFIAATLRRRRSRRRRSTSPSSHWRFPSGACKASSPALRHRRHLHADGRRRRRLSSPSSLPIDRVMQRLFGIDGLVLSSGIAIVLHTAVLMLLLPRRLDTCRRGEIVERHAALVRASAPSRPCRRGWRRTSCRTAGSAAISWSS